MIGVPLAPRALGDLAERHGGTLRNGAKGTVRRLVPIGRAAAGDLTVLLNARYVEEAVHAVGRGAMLLIDESLAIRDDVRSLAGWFHPHATWAMAELLEAGDAPADQAVIGSDCRIGPGVHLLPRVRIGSRVTIAPGAVIGAAGFGWVSGPDGKAREIPQVGGVIIEDDVHIGALCTIAAGTIGPTIVRRGAKLDAQVHVGHNCEIGEDTMIAAQTGLAGSVVIGKGVLIGGQVGIADHLTIGDGARIAAKSGVIGDVPPGVTMAGYPAVERQRWLRGLAEMYRVAGSGAPPPPPSAPRAGPTSPPFDPARAATIPALSLNDPRVPAPSSVRGKPPIRREDE
ncbi:MAG: UDP-3-O-[3-hydroxymyristoyl] glucosamine N-acyltransferase [Labilithrix sp.]|nr:UDP-3-O-[3-hydroxymyristoyl] glucosamine N-acyltransferase [Labilithrix sp.]